WRPWRWPWRGAAAWPGRRDRASACLGRRRPGRTPTACTRRRNFLSDPCKVPSKLPRSTIAGAFFVTANTIACAPRHGRRAALSSRRTVWQADGGLLRPFPPSPHRPRVGEVGEVSENPLRPIPPSLLQVEPAIEKTGSQ